MEPVTSSRSSGSRGKWQWKSNSDPWSETEESQWESYSPEHNYLIEKGYHEKRKEVDLGDYIVSVQHMVQSKKGNAPLQRPIRRKDYEEEEEMGIRSERYFETELPKTINKIFGDLQDFVNFFSRRNPEILDLTNNFQEFEKNNDLDGLKKIICPQLISCLEQELLEPIEDQLKDDSIKKYQKKVKLDAKRRCEKLISLFKKEFMSFEEFYGSILKSYTMNTSLYLNVNQYLRNESWTAAENLLPYVICLCKAFFSEGLNSNFQKKEGPEDQENPVILYRGTALDKSALSSYEVEKGSKFFSWNSVTSTSTNRKMAEKFMYESVNIENDKYPVLFIIEVPRGTELIGSEYMKWLDIHQYSAIPNEDEVILAPGSVFEVREVSIDQEKRTTIKLKLKHEIESLAHGGLIMHGVLQTKMMTDQQVKIVCLEGEELSETFKYISGNKLIEEIEFCVCTFNRRTLEEMVIALSSLNKVKKAAFLSCKFEDEQEISIQRLEGIKCLKKLEISCRAMKINNFLLQGLGYLSQSASLTIDFSYCDQEITSEGIESPEFRGFKYLTQLDSITLNFTKCASISEEGLKNLASKGLKYFTQLTSLNLNFSECKQITNKIVQDLASKGLKYLTQLTSLTLNFSDCNKITNKGVQNLASHGLKHLTKLTSLSLNFYDISRINDEGAKSLVCDGLKHLTQLTSLTLNFSKLVSACLTDKNHGITDAVLNDLASEGLKPLTQLNSLSLDFSGCHNITNEGMQNFASQGVKHLTQLSSLSLSFEGCYKVINGGLKHSKDSQMQKENENFGMLKHQQKKETKDLKDFRRQIFVRRKAWHKVTSFVDDFQALGGPSKDDNFETLSPLLEVPQLCEFCKNFIKDNGPALRNAKLTENDSSNTMIAPKFRHLVSLTMTFSDFEQIAKKGAENLTFQGLKHLASLAFLWAGNSIGIFC